MSEEQSQRRARILVAVMDLVASRGPDGVTLREVARQAGVSLGLVSYHYKTRSKLFRATLDWIVEQFTEIASDLSQAASSPRSRLAFFFLCQEKLLLEQTKLLTAWFTYQGI